MKNKKIRMYLAFWFKNKAPEKYTKLSNYGVSKFGGEYINFAYVQKDDKKYVDFDEVLNEFIENYKKEYESIKDLVDNIDGKFYIEVVPEFSAYSSAPAIVLNKELIDLINLLGNKFEYLEIDTYII